MGNYPQGTRGRSYENALNWLEDAGLIHRAYAVGTAKRPLKHYADTICPLEVKAGINPRSKSLKSYDSQFNPTCLARTNLLNLKRDGKIFNLPLYAVSLLKRLITRAG